MPPLDATAWTDSLPNVVLPWQQAPGGAVPSPATVTPGQTSAPAPQTNYVPTIDVGGSHAAPIGQPGSEFTPSQVNPASVTQPHAMAVPTTQADTAWANSLPDVVLPWNQAKGATAPASVPKQRGFLANIAAGANDTLADAVGAPVDALTGAVNLGLRGVYKGAQALSPLIGAAPQITNPVLGSDWNKSAMGLVGADPRNVVAQSEMERIARGAGSGAVSTLMPMGIASALPEMAGIPGAIQDAMQAGGAKTVGTAGFTGGALGQEAQDSVPDPYKPIAGFAGNMIGGGIPIAARGLLGAAGNIARPMVGNYLAPLTQAGQEALAAQRLASSATDLGAVRDTLSQPIAPLVPGSPATTFQMTGDPGLGSLERAVAAKHPDLFQAISGQQNQARVASVDRIGRLPPPVGSPPSKLGAPASPDGITAAVRQELADIDSAGERVVNQLRQHAQSLTDSLGAHVPVGGDAQSTALQGYGQRIRAGLDTLNQEAKARVSRLYDAIDPHGTLTVNIKQIKEAARRISKEVPKNAAPMEGDAPAILGTMQMQPNVQTFREVAALRSRLTDAMRKELYENGRSQTYRRLTQMLSAVDETLDNGLEAALQDPEVADRLQSGGVGQNESGSSAANTEGAGGSAVGREAGVSAQSGGPAAQRQRPGGSSSADAMASIGATAPRRPESIVDFLISKGGVRDAGGELRAADAGLVHHQMGGRLINPRGMPDDMAREALAEEGFIRPNADINDYKDAVVEHLRGNPRYRISDQAEGTARDAEDRAMARDQAARATARNDVIFSTPDGVTLSPAEIDHATALVLSGMHPTDAVTEAARAGEERALQANAQTNAFPSPGVPIAAQQAAMPDSGGPTLAPNFDQSAAARYRAANAAHAQRVATFEEPPGVGAVLATGKRAGEWKLGDSRVASEIFNSGKGAAERVQAFLKAGGDNAGLVSDLKDYATFSFRRAAEGADGTIDPGKAASWLKSHSEALAAFPDLAAKFSTAANARKALDEAALAAQTAKKEFEKSAIAPFLGDGDPTLTVGRILRSPGGAAQMKAIASQVKKYPAAIAGLRRAAAEFILNELRSNAFAAGTAERALKQDVTQTFIRRSLPALRHVLTPEEIDILKNTARDIQQSQQSVLATKLPGGSNTAQDLAGMASHGAKNPSVVGMLAAMEAAGELVGHVGSAISGPVGMVVGKAAGMVGIPVLQAMRAAGFARVDDLVTEGILYPDKFRMLMTKLPSGAFQTQFLNNAKKQIMALGAISAARSQGGRHGR